ncbi:MAG TPA: putative inorganic carbon transporter subunit DabA, partial [Gemmataceae bacterium]|nr:putative inorganic carbon transporter subunit DabA [Gemmataceae bacterium]
MSTTVVKHDVGLRNNPARSAENADHLQELKKVIEHAAHLLPAQGPITVFIHHNTLHAFEDMTFDDAVRKGGRVFGCQPYLTEDRYREELNRGRIRFSELQDVLEENLGARAHENILGLCTRLQLRLGMLQYPLRSGPTEELVWFVAEKDALRRIRNEASSAVRQRLIAETRRWVMRDLRGGNEAAFGNRQTGSRPNVESRPPIAAELASVFARFKESAIESWDENAWEAFTLQALWRICCGGAEGVPPFAPPPVLPIRHRDLLLKATGVDSDRLVNDLLIRFCPAFLDQGLAHWPLPRRDEGFYRSFCALYRQPGGPPARWMRGLAGELARVEEISPLESIHESLGILGIAQEEWDDFLSATLLALRGWAGIIRIVEERPDRVVHPVLPGSLIEYLAIRLVLERWAIAYCASDALGFTGNLQTLREYLRNHIGASNPPSVEQRAFQVFQLAQVLGWTPEELSRLAKKDWSKLLEEIETFSGLERRTLFHHAYERRFNAQTLDAIALHAPKPAPTPRQPRFQAVFCIDEREESLRRHLEELAPDVETFSVAGFYFIPMYFRGIADAHYVPLCPAVMLPQHWVAEQVVESLEQDHQRRARTRRALGMASHQIHRGSRTFVLGAVLSAAVGVLAVIPLVARILFPRLTSRIRKLFARFLQAPPLTRLQLERSASTPGPDNGALGFTLEEMTNCAERVLRDIGMTVRFSRLVLMFGHGSTSMNNPHESAHDCGACGGARGGPNGRAIAHMLNDPRIRERLEQNGIRIPPETVFVGGMHNTS